MKEYSTTWVQLYLITTIFPIFKKYLALLFEARIGKYLINHYLSSKSADVQFCKRKLAMKTGKLP
jgi:hypothetical protein